MGSCRDRTQERDSGWEQRHYLKSRRRSLLALAAYLVKILLFSLSTGTSHAMAYTILEGLRLRLADRFLHAPLGDVEIHSIGEIKNMMVDKIENLEPPLAHMIPEGGGAHRSAHRQHYSPAVH